MLYFTAQMTPVVPHSVFTVRTRKNFVDCHFHIIITFHLRRRFVFGRKTMAVHHHHFSYLVKHTGMGRRGHSSLFLARSGIWRPIGFRLLQQVPQ